MKPYIIKKGKHRSGCRLKLFRKWEKIHFSFCFTKSCLYDEDAIDGEGVSKVFGFSMGLHQENILKYIPTKWLKNKLKIYFNAVRIGYKCKSNKRFFLYSYILKEGVEIREPIKDKNGVNKMVYPGFILRGKFVNRLNEGKIDLFIDDTSLHISMRVTPFLFFYLLFFYFGGTAVAENDKKLFLDYKIAK